MPTLCVSIILHVNNIGKMQYSFLESSNAYKKYMFILMCDKKPNSILDYNLRYPSLQNIQSVQ